LRDKYLRKLRNKLDKLLRQKLREKDLKKKNIKLG